MSRAPAFTDVAKWWIWRAAPGRWFSSPPVQQSGRRREWETKTFATHAEALAYMVEESKVTP